MVKEETEVNSSIKALLNIKIKEEIEVNSPIKASVNTMIQKTMSKSKQ
jgi:hypothetical protein